MRAFLENLRKYDSRQMSTLLPALAINRPKRPWSTFLLEFVDIDNRYYSSSSSSLPSSSSRPTLRTCFCVGLGFPTFEIIRGDRRIFPLFFFISEEGGKRERKSKEDQESILMDDDGNNFFSQTRGFFHNAG